MARSRNFIEREVFFRLLDDVGAKDGSAYDDKATIYGDLSRLVVAFLASQSAAEIDALYVAGGWKPKANSRAIHAAALEWMQRYRWQQDEASA